MEQLRKSGTKYGGKQIHCRPKHTLPTTADPFQYFCLFVPIFFWAIWAAFNNAKACLCNDNSEKRGRRWTPTCEAEIKAWVASVICWSMFKTITFTNFYKCCADPISVKSWFPNIHQWQQMKRFFKVINPETDSEHKEDKMWRVRELWDSFISACKANYWPAALAEVANY